MAVTCLGQVKEGQDFNELAMSISACDDTRHEGGAVGWVGVNDTHVDHLLPRNARAEAITFKAGDVFIVETVRGEPWCLADLGRRSPLV